MCDLFRVSGIHFPLWCLKTRILKVALIITALNNSILSFPCSSVGGISKPFISTAYVTGVPCKQWAVAKNAVIRTLCRMISYDIHFSTCIQPSNHKNDRTQMHEDINELQLHFKSPIFPTEIIISKHLKKNQVLKRRVSKTNNILEKVKINFNLQAHSNKE